MDKCGCNLATCRMCKPDNEFVCDYNVKKICELSERMRRIEEHTERVRRIEEHKNRQIDENRKVSLRVDELLWDIQRIEKSMDNQVEYLQNEINDKIQKAFKYTPYPESLCKRFDNIEKEISRFDICNEIKNSEYTKFRKKLEELDEELCCYSNKYGTTLQGHEDILVHLQRLCSEMNKAVFELEGEYTDKKPHKCPACEEKGIIWG